jgi:hypothetical protein
VCINWGGGREGYSGGSIDVYFRSIDELSRSLLQRERRVRKTEILVNSEPISDAPAMGHILVSE